MNKHPDREECMKYLEEYRTPPHVVKHCIAVTDVAVKIARALNKHGYNLNLELIVAAGLMHDILRLEDRHWEAGSKLVKSLGYEEEADIILDHMTYSQFNNIKNLNEKDLVCLADRIVKEDKYVGLTARMEYIIKKVEKKGDLKAREIILSKKAKMQLLIDDIEKVIGKSIDDIVKNK